PARLLRDPARDERRRHRAGGGPARGRAAAVVGPDPGSGCCAVRAGPAVREAAAHDLPTPGLRGDRALQEWTDSERLFRRIMRGLDALAVVVTPLFQRGSLPYTLGMMLLVLIGLTVPVALTQTPVPTNLVLFEHPVELLVLPVAALAAVGAARSRRRLRAVFLISVTGYVVALLFLVAGAPDVATTQVLVETAMTV